MSRAPAGVSVAEATVAARRCLLDAYVALGPNQRAVVLVGAQAIYVRTEGKVALATGAFTTDADFNVNPAELMDEPTLEAAMNAARFHRQGQPGLYFREETFPGGVTAPIEVDLLVPAAMSGRPGGRRRRAAEVPGARRSRPQ